MGKIVTCAMACVLLNAAAWAQAATKNSKAAKQEKEDPVTTLKIVVTGGDKNAPVSNASVYVRYEHPRFLLPDEKFELDLKTDLEGIAKVKDVPRIRVLIQVVKDGWKPFGEYYQLTKDQQTVEIKLQPPPHWY
ncbi:MAG TPA: hypothetical protein VJN21_09885 [Candidatus Acidoferrales bacterium]|nr:hypothetical protein [Candidatus Acidoferrales bacterium]